MSTASARPGPSALCLAGPTAAGKSAVAMALAGERDIEIISVDSAQVYRGMDIGTAKPGASDRAAVPHHLIDILDPQETYSAARFASEARRLVAEIQSRGRLPLLVGGTMLYFKALREGLDTLPAADPAVRAQLEAEATERGWPALHAELSRVDPVTAARLPPGDTQRIHRALEVWRSSGRALSAWHGQSVKAAADGTADTLWPMVSMEPESRAWLHDRIAARLDAMLEAGFLEEVRDLRQRPELHADLPAMRCVGYRQAWAALEEDDPRMLRDRAIAATRQLAKRQLTWLRGLPSRTVVPCDAPDGLERALEALRGKAP
jgi:tRNA dimethylallyltransferase